jgi:peroxiredoxin
MKSAADLKPGKRTHRISASIYLIFLLFLLSVFNTAFANADKNALLGKTFPINLNEVCQESVISGQQENALKLVVFMPNDSAYEGMLEQSLNRYFIQRDAFLQPLKGQGIDVIYIKSVMSEHKKKSEDKISNSKLPNEGHVFLGGMATMPLRMEKMVLESNCKLRDANIKEQQKKIAQQLNMVFPKVDNAPASLFLLDKNQVVQWRDDDYAAQGEHLKPLERKVKTLLDAADPFATVSKEIKKLQVGDMAPDFKIDDTHRFSDLKGKTRLVTFYPAAFSGTLDTRICSMCCSVQITSLADSEGISEFSPKQGLFPVAKTIPDVERFAISSSTPALLEAWEHLLKTKGHIQLVNDPDYRIAQAYSSYDHDNGYNRRSVFIIDNQGRVAYIDWDYTREDNAAVQKALEDISKT